jgi:hypothetical protein
LPECLVELHILINAVDCSALWHPATVRAAARVVALTASNDVFLDLCGASRYVECKRQSITSGRRRALML